MLRSLLALLLVAASLSAQPRKPAPPRQIQTLELEVPTTPLDGDVLDIQVSDTQAKITVLLPDGKRTMTSGFDAETTGLQWYEFSSFDLQNMRDRRQNFFLPGSGKHVFLYTDYWVGHPQRGTYKILIDVTDCKDPVKANARFLTRSQVNAR